jgi:hypothetical protein
MDLPLLAQAILLLLAFPIGAVAIVRLALPTDEGPRLFTAPSETAWPRGVQEEEPIRYRVELASWDATRRSARPSEVGSQRLVARAGNLSG